MMGGSLAKALSDVCCALEILLSDQRFFAENRPSYGSPFDSKDNACPKSIEQV